MSQPPQRPRTERDVKSPPGAQAKTKPPEYGDTRRSQENNTHKGGATGTGGPGGTGGSVL